MKLFLTDLSHIYTYTHAPPTRIKLNNLWSKAGLRQGPNLSTASVTGLESVGRHDYCPCVLG
jgi:hypothetical protein